MNQEEIEQKIEKTIENPSPEYLTYSKNKIMATFDETKEKRKNSFIIPNLSFPKVAISFATIGTVALLVILAAYTIPSLLNPKVPQISQTGSFEITATKKDSIGVDLATSFIIKSKEVVTLASIKQALAFEPKTEYEIEEKGLNEFLLTPKAKLLQNKVYKILLSTSINGKEKELSWAFQTKKPLTVTQTLPADKSSSVPLNTGIEVTFSHEEVTNPESYFLISPNITGRFEKHGKTLAFVPKNLSPETIYTITVKKGLGLKDSNETLKDDYKFQFATKKEGGEEQNQASLYFGKISFEFDNKNNPAVSLSSYNTPNELKTSVYRFKNENAFISCLKQKANFPEWASYLREKYRCLESETDKIQEFQAKIEKQNYGQEYIVFPDKLENGYYLARFELPKLSQEILIQVSPLATYITKAKNKTLIWVNNTETQSYEKNAKIEYLGKNEVYETDESGIAAFETRTEKDREGNIIKIQGAGSTIFIPLLASYYYEMPNDKSALFWSYLATNKRLFRPTDTIEFWGFVKKREGETPKKLTVTLEKGYWGETTPIDQKEISVTNDNTIKGKFDLKDFSTGGYFLKIRDGENYITQSYLDVQTYRKPNLEIKITPSKNAIYKGETVTFVTSVKFFDQTPAQNINLKYYLNYSGDSQNGSLTTDITGKAIITINTGDLKPTYNQDYSPSTLNIDVNPSDQSEAEISAHGGVQVYSGNISLDPKTSYKDKRAKIELTANIIDIEKRNKAESAGDEDIKVKPADNVKINGNIVENYSEKIEDGETYDFINKTTIKRYRYESRTRDVGSFEVTTNQQGQAYYEFDALENKSFSIKLSLTDEKGRAETQNTYIYTGQMYYTDEAKLHLVSDGGKTVFKENEDVKLTLKLGDNPTPQKGKFLFIKFQNGIIDYTTSENPSEKFKFEKRFIPNIVANAVWFTGSTVIETENSYFKGGYGSANLSYDIKEKELKVEIETDKKTYEPKDEVKIKVHLLDKDGRGKEGSVILGAVDQSLNAIQWQQDLALGKLYENLPSGIISSYVSHQYPKAEFQGGGGGGGGGREDFKDVPLFAEVKTDASGVGSVVFKAPDNLTTFQIEAHAITPDLYAGDKNYYISTKLPFFVEVVSNNEFLEGDSPEIRITGYGENLKEGDVVSFAVKGKTLNFNTSLTGRAFEPTTVTLPNLTLGNHRIEFQGKASGYEDTLVRTISVKKSRLSKTQSSFSTLSENTKIDSGNGLSKVTFTEAERGQYLPGLYRIAWDFGSRADQKLARTKANSLLYDYFGQGQKAETSENYSQYQKEDGGIAILPYGGSDLLQSAKIADLSKGVFDEERLRNYFYKILENKNAETPERIAGALYGLSAMDEPILLDAQKLNINKITDLNARILIGLSLATSGGKEQARAILEDIVNSHGNKQEPYIFIEGKNKEQIMERTALVMMLAAKVGDVSFDKLYLYIQNNQSRDNLLSPEIAISLTQILPTTKPASVSFVISNNGTDEKISLKNGETRTIYVTKEEAPNLKFSDVKGRVGIVVTTEKPISDMVIQKTDGLEIQRYFESNGQITDNLDKGQTIKVILKYKIPESAQDGYYEIHDILPSGLAPIANPWTKNLPTPERFVYPSEVNGQRVSFIVYKRGQNEIYYYARVINNGTFIAEPPLIQSGQSPDILNIGQKESVLIK